MKTTQAPKFAIIRHTQAGRTWYQAKDVGCITRLRASVWSTPDREAAERLASEVGGHVVSEW